MNRHDNLLLAYTVRGLSGSYFVMKRNYFLSALFATAFVCLNIVPTFAADSVTTKTKSATAVPPPVFAITHHSLRVNGDTVRFSATAGSLILRNDKQAPTASVFFVAYTQNGVRDQGDRPLTFVYNGGPGSASLWLELGAFGPRRVVTNDNKATPPAPYELTANDYSLLDKSDLVFIDAPGTGFSRIVGAGKPENFFSVDKDAQAFAQFIRRYLDKYHRWNSPKFLLGESYGTTRSAALSEVLQREGIALNGIVLLSSILNFQTASFAPGNDLAYALFLPTYAAIAWYHKALPEQPEKLAPFLKEVEKFAMGDYADAL
ncbi:MAG: hypothetical protein L0H37_09130, partial [Nitrosospira sp.]|nr:hypothetical protein [Nitrosospira sp.]